MTASDDLRLLADHVALLYHEARNVRHLISAGHVEPQEWKYVIALPTRREEAWAALQDVRKAARQRTTVSACVAVFEKRFHVSLNRLETLFAHPAWRNSSYGGNAWHGITQLVRRFADYIEQGQDTAEVRDRLATARHNTGSIEEKLARLDRSIR